MYKNERKRNIHTRTNENISFNCHSGENERRKKEIKMETAACLMTSRAHINELSIVKFSH